MDAFNSKDYAEGEGDTPNVIKGTRKTKHCFSNLTNTMSLKVGALLVCPVFLNQLEGGGESTGTTLLSLVATRSKCSMLDCTVCACVPEVMGRELGKVRAPFRSEATRSEYPV